MSTSHDDAAPKDPVPDNSALEVRALEVPLVGDGVTVGIVRIGATVRRPVRPFTATVQAFLAALHERGFTEAPVPLGYDDSGREVLSYVEGAVPTEPVPLELSGNDVLIALARLIRREHDAALGWEPPADAVWGDIPGVVPPGFVPLVTEPELVAHMDYCPGNVVFRDGLPAALIDFDLARPTSRLADVVNALGWWVPLHHPLDRPAEITDADVVDRVAVFVDAYGLTLAERGLLVPMAVQRARNSVLTMRAAADVDPVFARMWDDVGQHRLPRTVDWITEIAPRIAARLARDAPVG